MKDLKLFLAISGGLILFLLFFLPPENWWFLWDYLASTPWWFVIGQAWPLWVVAGIITAFLIWFRELR